MSEVTKENLIDNYCQTCGRKDKCSRIYVCEYTKDFNGYDLPGPICNTYKGNYNSSDDESCYSSDDSSVEYESTEEEESDSESEDEGDIEVTKCW